MQLIIGLGNPGDKYSQTRHNAGFLALDHFLESEFVKDGEKSGIQKKFQSLIYEIKLDKAKILVVYPQTYMNNSGQAVKEIMDFYKLLPKNILVMHDDVDLPLGTIKYTENSSSAGHNGIKSIIENIGTQQFRRIRIGIENRENKTIPPTEVFVLQNFTLEELQKIPFSDINTKLNLELTSKS